MVEGTVRVPITIVELLDWVVYDCLLVEATVDRREVLEYMKRVVTGFGPVVE